MKRKYLLINIAFILALVLMFVLPETLASYGDGRLLADVQLNDSVSGSFDYEYQLSYIKKLEIISKGSMSANMSVDFLGKEEIARIDEKCYDNIITLTEMQLLPSAYNTSFNLEINDLILYSDSSFSGNQKVVSGVTRAIFSEKDLYLSVVFEVDSEMIYEFTVKGRMPLAYSEMAEQWGEYVGLQLLEISIEALEKEAMEARGYNLDDHSGDLQDFEAELYYTDGTTIIMYSLYDYESGYGMHLREIK